MNRVKLAHSGGEKQNKKTKTDTIHPWVLHLDMTYLLPNGISRHQLRLNSDEQCDKCSTAKVPQKIIITIWAIGPFITVP